MNKRELTRFRKLIQAERERILGKLGTLEEEISQRSASQGAGGQAYSNHMADIGSDAMEQEQAFLHTSQGTAYLRQLDDALVRIERGTYGQCEECEDKIPVKRLEAFLPAVLCISCKSQQEKLHRS